MMTLSAVIPDVASQAGLRSLRKLGCVRRSGIQDIKHR
jgi:hypothetical protein